MSEPAVVICNPTDGYAPTVAGCTREYCHLCAAEVWVAPSSKVIAPNADYVCLDCAPGLLAAAHDPHLEQPHPAQIAELRARRRP